MVYLMVRKLEWRTSRWSAVRKSWTNDAELVLPTHSHYSPSHWHSNQPTSNNTTTASDCGILLLCPRQCGSTTPPRGHYFCKSNTQSISLTSDSRYAPASYRTHSRGTRTGDPSTGRERSKIKSQGSIYGRTWSSSNSLKSAHEKKPWAGSETGNQLNPNEEIFFSHTTDKLYGGMADEEQLTLHWHLVRYWCEKYVD